MQERIKRLRQLERELGLSFQQLDLLNRVLTHTSYTNENRKNGLEHNERLEFLGDAVLELVVSDYLYRKYPQALEGELTRLRAAVVCEGVLARKAKELKLGDYLLVGRGEAMSGGRERPSILADVFEAIVGAVYLDQGLNSAQQFILAQLTAEIEMAQINRCFCYHDYKTALQEYVQKHHHGATLAYTVVGEQGPDHAKLFSIEVKLDDLVLGEGSGKSKKEAEQVAAAQALKYLQSEAGHNEC